MRRWIQAVSTLLTNGYLKGFLTGSIYQGPIKHACVPTLNCYSCPGALFACPIGAAQAIFAGSGGLDVTATQSLLERLKIIGTSMPLFVVGFLTIIGALFGRASCGWLCPFGFLQDLVHRLPTPKLPSPRLLSYGKYFILVVFVVLLPLFLVDSSGFGAPYFCKLICPAGTLEGGWLLPLYPGNASLRSQLGWLFTWKSCLLVALLVLMALFRRPFCSWLCPLGAFLAPFNKVSLYRLDLSEEACIKCGKCSRVCPSGLPVLEKLDGLDCIRCLDCAQVCPTKAISFTCGGGGRASAPAAESGPHMPDADRS